MECVPAVVVFIHACISLPKKFVVVAKCVGVPTLGGFTLDVNSNTSPLLPTPTFVQLFPAGLKSVRIDDAGTKFAGFKNNTKPFMRILPESNQSLLAIAFPSSHLRRKDFVGPVVPVISTMRERKDNVVSNSKRVESNTSDDDCHLYYALFQKLIA
jgi:hypothetical protein